MNAIKTALYIAIAILIQTSSIFSQTVTGEPAGIPRLPEIYQTEPWEDPLVTSINRDRARATS